MLAHVPSIEMDETTKNQVLAQASFLRALWYFQVNLLWDKGTMPLEPKDASYIPEDASEQEIWDQEKAVLQPREAVEKLLRWGIRIYL